MSRKHGPADNAYRASTMATERTEGAESRRSGPRVGPVWLSLTRAVEALSSPAEERTDGLSPAAVADALGALESAVHRAVDGPDVALPVDLPAFVHSNRLAGVIRRRFLEEIDAAAVAVEGRELNRVLLAFERVEAALERDCAQRFLGKLSGLEAPQLLAEVAHDMRSPLGSILFLAERLRGGQSGPVTVLQARQLGLVYSAALGLSGLVNDVMELSRGGLRLMDHPPIPFSVGDIMQQTLNIVRPMAEEKGLLLEATVPELDGRLGFPTALGRVLLNLCTNALKFTEKGSVRITAEASDRTRLEFSVADTGRGIPPQVMHTLFDAFRQRGKSSDYFVSSAGLGLATCHKLTHAMGGQLEVDSVVDRGTRFHFQLDLPIARQ